ncbi:hypothetical protein IE077_002899, partial [Cardiosporidium cionae]
FSHQNTMEGSFVQDWRALVCADIRNRLNSFLPKDIVCFAIVCVTKKFDARILCDFRTYEYIIPQFALTEDFPPYSIDDTQSPPEFTPSTYSSEDGPVSPSADRERFEAILQNFVGSHNFHNFSSRLKNKDPTAWRVVLSIKVR